MIHMLLVNLTPEAEWVAWRAAQHVWGRCISVQSAPDVEAALAILNRAVPFDQSPCPSLVLLGTGLHGDVELEDMGRLRLALAIYHTPLIGLANTSLGLECLRARRAPLDGVLLNPVQPEALRELAESLKLMQPLPVYSSASEARLADVL